MVDDENWKVVRDGRLLRALERQGFIKEPPENFRPHVPHGSGKVAKRWGKRTYFYVDDVPKKYDGTDKVKHGEFKYRGIEYKIAYRSGCFFPFVFQKK